MHEYGTRLRINDTNLLRQSTRKNLPQLREAINRAVDEVARNVKQQATNGGVAPKEGKSL